MVSVLERAIATHRAQLRSIDRAAMANVLLAYQDIMDRLAPLIELVQQEADEAGVLTAAQLFRLDRYQQLQQQALDELERLARLTGDVTMRAQAEAIRASIDAAYDLSVASAIGRAGTTAIEVGFTRLPTWAVDDLMGATRTGPLRELLDSFGDVASRTITQELVSGVALGLGPRVVARSISKALDISRNRALTITRTETLRAFRSATLRNYQANSDILRGWIWTAAHQSRTCAACLAMDGTFHGLSESMHSHPNCRCAMRPALRNIRMRKVETGDQWLRQQSVEVQDDVLGIQGGIFYRAGEVSLQDFIRVEESADWGRSIRDGGIGFALMQAGQERRAA